MKRKFFIIWCAGIAGTVAGLPYIFELQKDVLAEAALPLPVLGLLTVVQTAVIMAPVVYFGLRLSEAVKLRTPSLDLLVAGRASEAGQLLKNLAPLSVATGILAAAAIIAGDAAFNFFSNGGIERTGLAASDRPVYWKGILAAFYGGVVEEIFLRLLVMSLFAWIFVKLFRKPGQQANGTVFWPAILLASLLFGLGHLPATAAITSLTPLIIVRALVLNGVGGIIFGWLFWKKGFEAAVVSHFAADVALHGVWVLIVN